MGRQAHHANRRKNPRSGHRINEVRHPLSDSILLRVGQSWEHGQRQDLRRSRFGHRKITLAVAKVFVGVLQVEGNGIMNSRPDTSLPRAFQKPFPFLNTRRYQGWKFALDQEDSRGSFIPAPRPRLRTPGIATRIRGVFHCRPARRPSLTRRRPA
jgi:hypothetical protein